MKIHGEHNGNIIITNPFGDGEFLITINVDQLKSICASAKMNYSKQSNAGAVHVKFYNSKNVSGLQPRGRMEF